METGHREVCRCETVRTDLTNVWVQRQVAVTSRGGVTTLDAWDVGARVAEDALPADAALCMRLGSQRE